jgi:hypothetical protein
LADEIKLRWSVVLLEFEQWTYLFEGHLHFLLSCLWLFDVVVTWVGLEVLENISRHRGFMLEILMGLDLGFLHQKFFTRPFHKGSEVKTEVRLSLERLGLVQMEGRNQRDFLIRSSNCALAALARGLLRVEGRAEGLDPRRRCKSSGANRL